MKEESADTPAGPTPKAITQNRDRRQSNALVALMGVLLFAFIGLAIFTVVGMSGPPPWFLWSLAVSIAFAALVWKLRAGTAPAATLGAAICLQSLTRQAAGQPWTRTAMPELIALFLLTFAATRFARGRAPASVEPREARRGRTASQVIANLGFAALWIAAPTPPLFSIALAALAEATADTVSSEIGHALGRPTVLLTTLRRVPPGTDGGISLTGTLSGIAAAALLAALPVLLGAIDAPDGTAVFLAATAGLFFDSLLGATVERWGWIGNDLVNFLSTVFAGAAAYQAIRFLVPPMPFW